MFSFFKTRKTQQAETSTAKPSTNSSARKDPDLVKTMDEVGKAMLKGMKDNKYTDRGY